MAYCRQEGKDRIIFVTKEDHEAPSSAELVADDPNDPYEEHACRHYSDQHRSSGNNNTHGGKFGEPLVGPPRLPEPLAVAEGLRGADARALLSLTLTGQNQHSPARTVLSGASPPRPCPAP
ncbi:uncharacterized protein [Dipodomys merriami]|uniref:uncharacterized protein isoform X2 n=1 Tax=Dipodomys merriami TaxID=94247 RepID=UPI00384C67FD